MAISMKNHEDRIVALEQKVVESGFTQTKLYANIGGLQVPRSDYVLTLSQGISGFDALYFTVAFNNSYQNPNPVLILVSTFELGKTLDLYQGGDAASSLQRRFYVTKKSDTQLTLKSYDTYGYIYEIIGIKFSNVILYYVSNIIKLKFIRSINSRNSHFRQTS